MVEIRIMNRNPGRLARLLGDLAEHLDIKPGDAVLEVDIEKETDAVPRAVFERLITCGYAAFAKGDQAEQAVVVKEYDPAKHPRVLMVAPPAGG